MLWYGKKGVWFSLFNLISVLITFAHNYIHMACFSIGKTVCFYEHFIYILTYIWMYFLLFTHRSSFQVHILWLFDRAEIQTVSFCPPNLNIIIIIKWQSKLSMQILTHEIAMICVFLASVTRSSTLAIHQFMYNALMSYLSIAGAEHSSQSPSIPISPSYGAGHYAETGAKF